MVTTTKSEMAKVRKQKKNNDIDLTKSRRRLATVKDRIRWLEIRGRSLGKWISNHQVVDKRKKKR